MRQGIPERIPELVVPGKRLGRGIHHDPRSLRYLLPPAQTVQSVEWERHIPILDQDPLPSCVGNSGTGNLGTGPLWDAIMRLFPVVPTLDEAFAITLWSDCEKLDGGVGYPPETNGTYGLSAAKVLKARGLISGYQHATSVDAAHTAIQKGPFMFGVKWFTGMDEPTREGIVKPTGTVRGGHEPMCDKYDAGRDLWWFPNSWGPDWGLNGRFAMDTPSLGYLLSQKGDITSLVPLTEPAPTPGPAPAPSGPTPTPEQCDALNDWAPRSAWWWPKYARKAAAAWEAASGA